MANLKEIRLRITSVSSTQQITKAMKMVSAAKLRRAQDAIIQMRPYANKLRDIMENVSGSLDGNAGGQYAKERKVEKVLIVAINSNRGLCGGFNANVIRTVNRLLNHEYATQANAGQVKILAIGKKASDFFNKKPASFAGHHNEVYNSLKFDVVAPIAESIMKQFADGTFDKVVLVYNQFKNAAVQNVQNEQLLPVTATAIVGAKAKSKTSSDYIYNPGKEEIVNDLIPRAVKTQLFKALLDSQASEHGARMTAMSKATDNAQELLRDLRITYNKARQASITNEILEIVAGAEALKG
ncbi:MAG: ATP synthase F1 subunit gamma [Bacteroidetes bacterium]|nr:ATP synthase F1 subunit gamma [Bacteroidota bacterium]